MYSFSEPSPLNVFIYNLTRNWNVNEFQVLLLSKTPCIYNLTRNWNVNEDDLVNDPMGDEIYNLTRNWNVNNVGTTL